MPKNLSCSRLLGSSCTDNDDSHEMQAARIGMLVIPLTAQPKLLRHTAKYCLRRSGRLHPQMYETVARPPLVCDNGISFRFLIYFQRLTLSTYSSHFPCSFHSPISTASNKPYDSGATYRSSKRMAPLSCPHRKCSTVCTRKNHVICACVSFHEFIVICLKCLDKSTPKSCVFHRFAIWTSVLGGAQTNANVCSPFVPIF